MSRWRFLPSYHYEDNTDGKIDNPAELQLRDYTIAGNCGENILTYPYANTTATRYGVTFTDNGDGSITVSGTATDSAYFMFSSHMPVNKGDTFTLRANSQDKSNMRIGITRYKSDSYGSSLIQEYSTTEDIYTYTVKDDETKYITVFMKRDKNGEECTGTFKPELLKGKIGDYSTATGKYEIPIKISGKNMFNVNQEINFRFPSLQTPSVDGNTITVSNAAYATGGMWCNIPVKAGAYTLSVGSTTNNIYINYFTEPINEWNFSTMTVGAHVISPATTPPVALPIEAQADGYIVIFALFTSASAENTVTTAVFKNIQVERGTVATAYEPYTEPRTQAISFDNPVGIGESISMRADNLPAITLNKGSNIITVETDITPTGVTYQYYTY